jgi:predicted transcriptional regulator
MEQYKLTESDNLKIFPALESELRRRMLTYIKEEGPVPHSKVAKKFGLNTALYNLHMNQLLGVGLVKNSWKRYYAEEDWTKRDEIARDLDVVVTEKGNKVIKDLLN